MKEKTFVSWSGGKDSALALSEAIRAGFNIQALVSTVNEPTGRITMHGVRRQLLRQQAASLRLPLFEIELPDNPHMAIYEERMRKLHMYLKNEGFGQGVFGDIVLEDLKAYRETLLAKENLKAVFPLWGMNSKALTDQFCSTGFRAIVVCVNTSLLSADYCGQELTPDFFKELPSEVDPAGENGEYHSFVFDGPGFSFPVSFSKGEVVVKSYPSPRKEKDCFTKPASDYSFSFLDLLPA